jgi:hypothetical protein
MPCAPTDSGFWSAALSQSGLALFHAQRCVDGSRWRRDPPTSTSDVPTRSQLNRNKFNVQVGDYTSGSISVHGPERPTQTWKTFLHNHLGQLVSIDFFTVPTVTLKVLFVFIVLEHRRREVLHCNVTEHPTAAWTSQQIIEAFADRGCTEVSDTRSR